MLPNIREGNFLNQLTKSLLFLKLCIRAVENKEISSVLWHSRAAPKQEPPTSKSAGYPTLVLISLLQHINMCPGYMDISKGTPSPLKNIHSFLCLSNSVETQFLCISLPFIWQMPTKKDIYGLCELSVAQLHFHSGNNVSCNILFPENVNLYPLSVNSYPFFLPIASTAKLWGTSSSRFCLNFAVKPALQEAVVTVYQEKWPIHILHWRALNLTYIICTK